MVFVAAARLDVDDGKLAALAEVEPADKVTRTGDLERTADQGDLYGDRLDVALLAECDPCHQVFGLAFAVGRNDFAAHDPRDVDVQ